MNKTFIKNLSFDRHTDRQTGWLWHKSITLPQWAIIGDSDEFSYKYIQYTPMNIHWIYILFFQRNLPVWIPNGFTSLWVNLSDFYILLADFSTDSVWHLSMNTHLFLAVTSGPVYFYWYAQICEWIWVAFTFASSIQHRLTGISAWIHGVYSDIHAVYIHKYDFPSYWIPLCGIWTFDRIVSNGQFGIPWHLRTNMADNKQ